jgi:cell division protein FtsW
MLISRSDKGLIADWWFTVDRLLLGCVLVLMAAGVLFSMAASPPVASRIGLDHFHFFSRQLMFLAPAVIVLLVTSMMSPVWARRAALLAFFGGLAAMVAALFIGPEIKGAHRWLDLGPMNVQPSEFVKPAFAVCAAWFLAEGTRRPDMPGMWIAFGLFGLFAGPACAATGLRSASAHDGGVLYALAGARHSLALGVRPWWTGRSGRGHGVPELFACGLAH